MTSRAIALKHFKKTDPHFHDATRAYHSSLPVRLVGKRTRNALFERLVRTVISQQLGVAAARSIFARVKKVCNGTVTPDIIMKKRLAAFRNAGLSAAKIKTLKTIARAVKQGELDLVSLGKSSEADATEKLLGIEVTNQKLSDPGFLANAEKDLVEEKRVFLADAIRRKELLEKALKLLF